MNKVQGKEVYSFTSTQRPVSYTRHTDTSQLLLRFETFMAELVPWRFPSRQPRRFAPIFLHGRAPLQVLEAGVSVPDQVREVTNAIRHFATTTNTLFGGTDC